MSTETLWNKRMDMCLKFLGMNLKLPVTSDVYEGFQIGNWLRSQIYQDTKGDLKEERVRKLNESIPCWNQGIESIREYNEKYAKEHWNDFVKEGEHSILLYDETMNLHMLHKKGIHSCEDMLIHEGKTLNSIEKLKLISIIYCFGLPYADLIFKLFGCNVRTYTEIHSIMTNFHFLSKEDMLERFERLFAILTEQERKFIQLRFGLKGQLLMYEEIERKYNIPKNAIMYSVERAIRKLSKPENKEILLRM